jgi:hypothetical protein
MSRTRRTRTFAGMTHSSTATATGARRRPHLGIGLPAVVGLALLAAPRIVLHDLDLIQEGSVVNAVLTFVPPAAWIAVVVWKRVPNPVLTLLAVGLCYGVLLLVFHQLLWSTGFGDNPPRLGGNLGGLDPAAQALIIRSFAGVSSLVTGTAVGAISGLLAWGLSKLLRR